MFKRMKEMKEIKELTNKKLEEALHSQKQWMEFSKNSLSSTEGDIEYFTNRIKDAQKEIDDCSLEIDFLKVTKTSWEEYVEKYQHKIDELEAEIAFRIENGIVTYTYEELEAAGQIVLEM